MTLAGRHLLLGLIPLICGQAAATCYGNACPEQHETATAQGLLGDSLNAVNAVSECHNKSYTAPQPVRLQLKQLHQSLCVACIHA